MKLTTYVKIWFTVLMVLSLEFYALNKAPQMSLLAHLKAEGHLPAALDISPVAGSTLSLWLGWIGFGAMVLGNVYSLRKRMPSMKKLGKINDWLNFHIFCGLVGPVFVLFHTNFKVGGIVALSFWCMVISFSSGIIGRYFYLQLVQQKTQVLANVQALEARLEKLRALTPSITAEILATSKTRSLALVGIGAPDRAQMLPGPFGTLTRSLVGDIRIRLELGRVAPGLPATMRPDLQRYALSSRRLRNMEAFRLLMGYWHSFHSPFAVFMYIVAAVHITSSLVFMVGK